MDTTRGWSEQEEAKIAELMKQDKLNRIEAIQKMCRLHLNKPKEKVQ